MTVWILTAIFCAAVAVAGIVLAIRLPKHPH